MAVAGPVAPAQCRSRVRYRRLYKSTGSVGSVSLEHSASHLGPNAYPGMANKLVAPLAQRIFLAFGATARHFASSKVRAFGAPIRQAFLDVSGRSTSAGEAKDKKTLLVFGGSGGAHALNLAMMVALPLLFKDGTLKSQLSVIHQTGQKDYDMVKAHYDAAGLTVEVMPFLFDMPTALRAADLVVSRSGAMTMAELTVCGKPAVLIPFPQSILSASIA